MESLPEAWMSINDHDRATLFFIFIVSDLSISFLFMSFITSFLFMPLLKDLVLCVPKGKIGLCNFFLFGYLRPSPPSLRVMKNYY